ncbi:MAG TPA: preprotein translocase subunit YajC [Rhodospirillales bacterium]|nr:preprotein translocase subunit YajC [Rhodospirillales bacterium]
MWISPAYAQAAGGQGGDFFVTLLPLILIFVVFWLLLIRPQQRKVKEHQQMIQNLKKGDTVVTGGGIVGKIVKVDAGDNLLLLEIAPNVQVRVVRHTIAELLTKPKPANQNQSRQGEQAAGGFLGKLFPRK